jgi:hypothetical protein
MLCDAILYAIIAHDVLHLAPANYPLLANMVTRVTPDVCREIPDEVTRVVTSYLTMVDARIPGRITGFYLVGSLALHDYRSGQSDVDFVLVTNSPLTAAEQSQLEQVHRRLAKEMPHPKLDGVYVTWPELQSRPDGAAAPYCLQGNFSPRGGFAANPVTWCLLSRYPLSWRGLVRPDVYHNQEELREWCRGNLQGYWTRWLQSARTCPKRFVFSLFRQATTWAVLGVPRLHATIRNGDILSKSAAGAYALKTFPSRWGPIIQDALSHRNGVEGVGYRNPFTRRRDALAFMEYVIADAIT